MSLGVLVETDNKNVTAVKVKVPRARGKKIKEAVSDKKIMSQIRRSHDFEINLVSPKEFFEKIDKPVESRLYSFIKSVEAKSEEQLDVDGYSKIIEYNLNSGDWRWRKINNTADLKEILKNTEKAHSTFMKLREANWNKLVRSNEDAYGGQGFADDYGVSQSGGLQVRNQFTPLIGTPFFKQMYLYDYWEMHSKCFWYSNYSGIAKLIIDMTRNFVLGKGFNITFDDPKAEEAWKRYEERSDIQHEVRNWNDDLTKFGENMLLKVPTKKGIIHRAFDPSTIWEIVTDPEDIRDIKYYHQQYSTQYQLYGTKDAPTSKYIINQLPPQLVQHTKVNVTSYEKRGRSDLLGALLYFKYYEDYVMAKLARAKNEAAFIWDVTIDGSDEDVQAYINSTESIVDVPPGSENVHNKAITRTPLSPTFGKAGGDQIAQDILSYIAMSVSIPVNYMGTFGTSQNSRAGSLVATEPVSKKMGERQAIIERMLRRVVVDVLVSEKLDPKSKFEINFPEMLEEDRSKKIQDLVLANQERVLSHETISNIIAKELKVTDYDYSDEQAKILKEQKRDTLFMQPPSPDLTQPDKSKDNNPSRALDRSAIKDEGKNL